MKTKEKTIKCLYCKKPKQSDNPYCLHHEKKTRKKQTKKEEKIAKAIKRFSRHEDNIKILKEVVDIYNRNWEYLQEKHQEYTTDEVETFDCGDDIPSEDEALYAFKSLLKIK